MNILTWLFSKQDKQEETTDSTDLIEYLETEARIRAELGRHHKRMSRTMRRAATTLRQRKENDERNRLSVRRADETDRD